METINKKYSQKRNNIIQLIHQIFLNKQIKKDEEKLKDFFKRVQQVKTEEDSINLFKHYTSNKNFHHQNLRPIDRVEYLGMFQLYDKLLKSLVAQLIKQQELDNIEQCCIIEQKIADIISQYTWLLLTGKHRWSEEILKEYINKQCSYLVDIFTLSYNQAVYFQIYKAIPINDYELDSRNQILAFFSHFDRNVEIMKQNLHDYFIHCLSSQFPVHDNQKIYDEKVEQFLQLTDNDYIKSNSSYSIIKKITQDILKINDKDQSSLKLQINLICCLVHYIKQSLSKDISSSHYYQITSCISLLTQIYYDEKKKYKSIYRSLEYLKIKGDGPKELFEEISSFIDQHKETQNIQLMLDFLANLEYTRLFSNDLLAPVYEKSSLFYKYEQFFYQVLEDIYDHCNADTPLKYNISKVILLNTMNLKDFLEISLQTIESLRYLMKTFQANTQIQQQSTSIQRQNLIDLHQKLLNMHKNIFMSFARSEWIFDSAIQEIYLAYSSQIFPEFYRFDIQSELQVKVVEVIVKYVRKGTMLNYKYKDNRREVNDDEFYFVIKVYLKIIEENISEEHYEEYQNNLFFNVENLAHYCSEKRNNNEDNTVSCLLLNLCFKQSNPEQMENYFSFKSENKVIQFEYAIDLFLKEGIQIDSYFDNFITCCSERIYSSSENIRNIYIRMIVKYNFAKLFENSNSQIQQKLPLETYNEAVQEIQKQTDRQITNIKREKDILKKYIRELQLTENVNEEYSFLYKNVIYWNNIKYDCIIYNTKGLFNSINDYTVEENKKNELFKIYYEYSLQLVKQMSCYTQKNIIGYTFIGVSQDQKKLIEQFKIEEKIIELLSKYKNNLNKIGKYLLRRNSKEKYIKSLCDNEEETAHEASQQLVIYLNYLSLSSHIISQSEDLFKLLIDIFIGIFQDFLNVDLKGKYKIGESITSLIPPVPLNKKIDSIYTKSINILIKLGPCISILQKQINQTYNQNNKNINELEQGLNKNESPLVREKFFDLIQFQLQIGKQIIEKPENIIKFSLLLDKILLTIGLQSQKKTQIGKNINERYILMYQTLTKSQNNDIINTYMTQILPKFRILADKLKNEGMNYDNKKYVTYLTQYYEQQNSMIPYQIIQNEIISKENQPDVQGMYKIFSYLDEIAQVENSLIKSICLIPEYQTQFQKYVNSYSKFKYLNQLFYIDLIDKEELGKWCYDTIIDQLKDLIYQNQNKRELNSLVSLLRRIYLAHTDQVSIDNTKSFILAVVDSMQYIDEDDNLPDQPTDNQPDTNNSESFKEHLLLLYFIRIVQMEFNEKMEESLIQKMFEKLLQSVNKNIPLNIYNLFFENSYLIEEIKEFSQNKSQYNKQGIKLYKHLVELFTKEQSNMNDLNEKNTHLSTCLQLLTQFVDYSNTEDILYIVSELLNYQSKEVYDCIFKLLCNLLIKNQNNEFFKDSIICKFAIINQINYIQAVQKQNLKQSESDFVLESSKNNTDLSENVISSKEFLSSIKSYFFVPNYYQAGVNNQEIKDILNKNITKQELQQQIEQIKNKKYFQEESITYVIMRMIMEMKSVNIKLVHVLINLFPQIIFIFKNKVFDVLNNILNIEQNLTEAGNLIQNLFEIVSIDSEFLNIYKSCLTSKLKSMIKEDTDLVKLIEVFQLVFPMNKKYQRFVMNYLAQYIKFGADVSKNYSSTNAQRWSLDYFSNSIHYKEINKDSHNILEEANKFIYDSLSKHLGELLQNKNAYTDFYQEYKNLMNELKNNQDVVFSYQDIVIQRDLNQLENLIDTTPSSFLKYHELEKLPSQINQSSSILNQQTVPIKNQQFSANTDNSQLLSKIIQSSQNHFKKKIEEKKNNNQEEDEWEDDDDENGEDNESDNSGVENKDVKNQSSKQINEENKEDEEWEDEDGDGYEDSGSDQDSKSEGRKQEDDDEDSSDFDHDGEKKQSGKKSPISSNSPLKNDIEKEKDLKTENKDITDLKLTENEKKQLSPNIKYIQDESQKDNLKVEEEKNQTQMVDISEKYKDEEEDADRQFQIEYDAELEDDDEEEEDEDDETIKKENEEWNKYLMLKERWSVARFINQDRKEQDQVKQLIYEYLRDLRRNKEKIALFVDIVKQLDDDDLRKYLNSKFPKQIALKNKTSSTKKKNEDKKKNKKSIEKDDDLDEFVDEDDETEEKSKKLSLKDKNNDDDDFEEVDEDNEDIDDDEEDFDEGNLLHISSSEERLSSDDENDFEDEEGDYDDEDNSMIYNDNESREDSELSENSDDLDDENDKDHNLENKSLNDRQWSPVPELPPQKTLLKLYLDNLVFYDEKAIENIVKSLYSGSFNNQIISNELLNPIHGPQLMDAIFFLLVHPELDKYQEIKEDKDLDFLVQLGDKKLFLKNYLVLYDNAMSFFRTTLCNNHAKHLLSYFTLDSIHWSYLPQLTMIKKLKKITNYQQMSGLQTLIMLFSDQFKYEDIYENKKQKMVLSQISKNVKSVQIVLNQDGDDQLDQSQITIQNPVLRQVDIDNILHYYYFENEKFKDKTFLFSFLKKGLTKNPKYIQIIIEQFIENQSQSLINDVIDLMNKGINDVKSILEQQQSNSRKFALSHLYEIISNTESNPIYEVFLIHSFETTFFNQPYIFNNTIKNC